MPQNRLLPPAVLASAVLTLVPLQLISEAQEQSDDMRGIPTSRPAAQGDREFLTPEEFARVYSGDPVEGRQPVCEFGGGKQE